MQGRWDTFWINGSRKNRDEFTYGLFCWLPVHYYPFCFRGPDIQYNGQAEALLDRRGEVQCRSVSYWLGPRRIGGPGKADCCSPKHGISIYTMTLAKVDSA